MSLIVPTIRIRPKEAEKGGTIMRNLMIEIDYEGHTMDITPFCQGLEFQSWQDDISRVTLHLYANPDIETSAVVDLIKSPELQKLIKNSELRPSSHAE